jgi:very-short-patch-repair endonuclease
MKYRRRIAIARQLRGRMTDAEHLLWRHLRRRQLIGQKFRRQHPMGPFVVDFVCLEAGLIVELDGGQHAEQVQADLRREAWLRERGFTVLRFWNHDVMSRTEAVLEVILAELRARGRGSEV